MGKIQEIIDSGIPPGGKIGEGALDPGSPEVAAPKGFRQLEQKMPAREIARRAGFSIDRIKQTWGMCIVLCSCLSVSAVDINKGQTFQAGDTVTHTKLNNLLDLATINSTFITDKTSLTPVTADSFLYYSASAAGLRKTTLGTLLLNNTALITGQTEDAAPAVDDFLLTYDTSATGLKKSQLNSLVFTNDAIINGRTETNTPSATAAYFLMYDTGAYRKVARSNLFYQFASFSTFTNLTDHTGPTNDDAVWIYDSAGGGSKKIGLAALATNATAASTVTAGDVLSGYSTNDSRIVKFTAQQVKTYATNDSNIARTNQLVQKFVSSEYAIPTTDGGGVTNIAHGLSGTPQLVRWVFVCKTTDAGYEVGDEVDASHFLEDGAALSAYAYGANSTNAFISFTKASRIHRKDGSNNIDDITEANWRAKCYAEYFP